MRDIKFRVWDKVHKKMSSPFTPYEIADTDCDEDDITWLEKLYNLDDGYPIMQYTGLKDKNGKEIFEGDILLDNILVIWSDRFASFGLRKTGWMFTHFFDEALDRTELEIIGNIYENPDLLKRHC